MWYTVIVPEVAKMKNIENDFEYINIVNHILSNDKFNEIKKI